MQTAIEDNANKDLDGLRVPVGQLLQDAVTEVETEERWFTTTCRRSPAKQEILAMHS